MTQPSTETGGQGSTEGQGQGNPAQGQQGQQGQSQEDDFDSLPEATKTEIRRLRRENKQLRKGRAAPAPDKGQQGQGDTEPQGAQAVLGALAKALGVDLATGQPPASGTKQTTAPAASTDSDPALQLARVVPVVYTVSGELGANPAAVLDSRSFLAEIRDLDPTDADFAKDVKEAVQEAVTRNAALKATGATTQPGKQPPKTPKSGGDLAGGRSGSGEPVNKSPQQRLADAYAANSS